MVTNTLKEEYMKKLLIVFFLLCNILTSHAAVRQPVTFLQQDARWGTEPYSICNDPTQTIAASGCGPTSASMIVNYYIDKTTNPLDMVDLALKGNHRTLQDGTSWIFFKDIADIYNLEYLQTASAKEAKEWMETKEDALIICSMGQGLWTSEGHFVVLWKVKDKMAYINDPASTATYRNVNYFSVLSSQCAQYFCYNQNIEKTKLYHAINQVFENNFIRNHFWLSLGLSKIPDKNIWKADNLLVYK